MNGFAVAWLVLFPALAFYFLLWRPQQRRMAEARTLQGALAVGDAIMTTSGIYGRVVRLGDDDIDLEIAPATVIRCARGVVARRIDADAEASGEVA
ncbi:MAG: preprotein translocase subunit YajC [Actinomycetota bacterium]